MLLTLLRSARAISSGSKVLSAMAGGSASVTYVRQLVLSLIAESAAVASIQKVLQRLLAATSVVSSALSRILSYRLSSQVTTAASATRTIYLAFTATVNSGLATVFAFALGRLPRGRLYARVVAAVTPSAVFVVRQCRAVLSLHKQSVSRIIATPDRKAILAVQERPKSRME
jgi:hypothetical protein